MKGGVRNDEFKDKEFETTSLLLSARWRRGVLLTGTSTVQSLRHGQRTNVLAADLLSGMDVRMQVEHRGQHDQHADKPEVL